MRYGCDMEATYRRGATVGGSAALLLWSFCALFACLLARLPFFQMLVLVQSVALLTSLLQISLRRRWRILFKQPLTLWITTIGIVTINQLFYLIAFRTAPAAQVDLINYLWPVMIAIFGGFLANTKFSWWRIGGAFLGFSGVAVLLIGDGALSFHPKHLIGYLCAFGAALSWTVYTLVTRKYSESPADLVGLGAMGPLLIGLVGLGVSGQSLLLPRLGELSLVVGYGALSFALAFPLWDWAIKKGRFSLITVLSYATPALSILWLVVGGFTEPTWFLALASLLVILGSLSTTFEKKSAQIEAEEEALAA